MANVGSAGGGGDEGGDRGDLGDSNGAGKSLGGGGDNGGGGSSVLREGEAEETHKGEKDVDELHLDDFGFGRSCDRGVYE